ncbi:MAG TPA: pyruvate kinase, partial [Frankiaceae bacterium]|nr:pyruvate kinase [Frankiaceae bacterium]
MRRRQGAHDPLADEVAAAVEALWEGLRSFARLHADDVARVHPEHRKDAENLLHYLALRQQDVRHLQRALGDRGLSSLGRCEPHVLATVEAARDALGCRPPVLGPETLGFDEGRAALDRNTDRLLGPRPGGRVPRIMVTLPSEAADDYPLVRGFLTRGMDVARINCAHDDPRAWVRMADNVENAVKETGRACRLSMDLAGPKLRTGPLVDGPPVVKLRPRRDEYGIAVEPARVLLTAGGAPADTDSPPALPVAADWLARRRPADEVEVVDTRGSPRVLRVQSAGPGLCVAEVW